jgi:hypothetical protein
LRGFLLPFGPETFVLQFDTTNMKTEIHINIILPVVVYWYETWLVILKMCENRVLRKISGAKREKVTEDW